MQFYSFTARTVRKCGTQGQDQKKKRQNLAVPTLSGTPVVAKYERESVAKWAFVVGAAVSSFLGVIAIMFMMSTH